MNNPWTPSRSGAVLTLNSGSSSIKFGIFDLPHLVRVAGGKVDRAATHDATLSVRNFKTNRTRTDPIPNTDRHSAIKALSDCIENELGTLSLRGIGHRVVHGGPCYLDPEKIDRDLLDDLRRITPFDPEHLPNEIDLIEELLQRFRDVPQVACFDTAFHRAMPAVAKMLPLPRRFYDKGIRRYGFHGLSYAFLLQELERLGGPDSASGRLVLAHLGNGASLAAVRGGKPIDTTMAATPASGIPMSTRSGDIDPGLLLFLSNTEGFDAERWNNMVNAESGLLGISETSGDIRDLLSAEREDPRAAEALAVFCYGIVKTIGAFTAALNGIDTLVFSGGIGENSPEIRKRVCDCLGFLGVKLNEAGNSTNAALVSTEESRVAVRVIRTDEETMIARHVCETLGLNKDDQ